MIKIISDDEKLIDELNLVLKLFYKEEDFDALDIVFYINQKVDNDIIFNKLMQLFDESWVDDVWTNFVECLNDNINE